MSFKSLKLSQKLLKTIKKLGYTKPSEIQEKSIPLILNRRDILATSQTGTGKSASFIFPLLEILKENNKKRVGEERYKIKALILAPTRELVIQIHNKIDIYGENFTHKSVALYGGVKLGSQVSAIRSGANIAVGTTARVLDHIKNKSLNLSEVEIVILDEADKMLEMGFIDDIRAILSQIPSSSQSIMFSATFHKTLMSLAKSFLKNPITIEIEREYLSAQKIKQMVNFVNEEEKIPLLSKIIYLNKFNQVLVFTNTKLQADKIVEALKNDKIKASAIHGDKSQAMRVEALKRFKEKSISILVATDIAGRGVDIIDLPLVINFELPINSEEYIHRVGRTGRAEKKGEALSLVCKKEITKLKEIEELINKKLEIIVTDGFSFELDRIVSNRKSKNKDKKKGVDLKKAKELAEKMMGKKGILTKKDKKINSKLPRNKRHF